MDAHTKKRFIQASQPENLPATYIISLRAALLPRVYIFGFSIRDGGLLLMHREHTFTKRISL